MFSFKISLHIYPWTVPALKLPRYCYRKQEKEKKELEKIAKTFTFFLFELWEAAILWWYHYRHKKEAWSGTFFELVMSIKEKRSLHLK